ncbi:MAG: bacterial transcriptional activator domain-containing protein [Syntrophomonas sp.]
MYTDFELFAAEAQQALHYADISHPRTLSHLEQAAGYYNGIYLSEDLYDAWTSYNRVHLQGLYVHVLKLLAEVYAARNKPCRAIYYCNRCLDLEPTDEAVVRLSMRLLVSQGQRQKALGVYRQLVKTLSSEYNIVPEDETRYLYERII